VAAEIDEVPTGERTARLLQAAADHEPAEIDGAKPKLAIKLLTNSTGSGSSPDTKMTRQPRFFSGPLLKRSVTIELNTFTTRAPGPLL
jgi:hypothetical protein